MTIRSNKQDAKAVDLACQFDDQLRAGHSSVNGLDLENQKSSDHMSTHASGLSGIERRELEQAKAALWFLNRVRGDLDQSVTRLSKPSVSAAIDSTVNGISASGGSAGNGTEFERLGRFEIFETLGQGGFAKVFRAHDPLLERDVALKIPKFQAITSDESRVRFEREAKAAAILSHPAIVPIYETGTIGPITYIASGYCPGQTLATWFSEHGKSIETREAAGIVAQLAEAVQHAHQRGVVHRDLKPANILVEDGKSNVSHRVRITDFGLAKQMESDDASITVDGSVVGTPAYMSPEQARGSTELSASTDIFSLGIVLYELLTGHLPFAKSHQLATLRSIEFDTPIAPRKLNESVPKDLEAICLKCLRKSPGHRYQTAFAFAEDLNAWLSGRPVSARHLTISEKLVLWTKRNPATAAALAFAAFCLLVGLTLTFWQWRIAQSNLGISNLERDRAQKNVRQLQETVEHVLDEYGDSLANEVYLTPVHRRIINEMLVVHKRLIDEEAELLNVTGDTIQSYMRIARLHREMGARDRAREVYKQANELVALATAKDTKKLDELQPFIVDLMVQESVIDIVSGLHPKAEKILRQCINTMRSCESSQTKSEADYRWFKIYRHLGISLAGQQRVKESYEPYERSMKYAADMLADNPLNEDNQAYFGVSLQDMSDVYRSLGQNQKAINNLEEAKERFAKMNSNDSFEGDYRYRLASIQSNLGSIFSGQDRIDEAETHLDQALTALTELVAEQPSSARFVNRLAHTVVRMSTLLEQQDRYDEARLVNERGLELNERETYGLMKIRHKMYFLAHLGELSYVQFKENDKAIGLLQQAIKAGEPALIEFPEDEDLRNSLIEAYRHLAIINDGRHKAAEAIPLIERAGFHAMVLLKRQPNSRKNQDIAIRRVSYFAKRMGEEEEFAEAQQALIKLAEAAPMSLHIQYQTARYLSRLASHRRHADRSASEILAAKMLAIEQLKKAIEQGFEHGNLLTSQPEWDVLRDTNEFEQIIQSFSK